MSIGSVNQSELVRVALMGFGRVGRAVLELGLTRPWLQVVSVIARRDERHGQAARDTVPGAAEHLVIRTDAANALGEHSPDVVIMATQSRLVDIIPQLEVILAAGVRTILCTAEELAFVRPEDGPEAARVHALADEAGATIVATGVNPGFVLDLWPLLLSGLAWDVERLEARRIVDVSVFAPHTRRQLGIGHDQAAFEAGAAEGSIVGHLGFRESLRLLSEAMGQPADDITIETEPLMAEKFYQLADGNVSAGTTIGVTQRAQAWRAGSAWIVVELLLHAAPEQDGVRTVDETHIHGQHELHVTLDPGAGAIRSTAAQLVNGIPVALRAGPGLFGPGQLPPSAPWLAARPPQRSHRHVTVPA